MLRRVSLRRAPDTATTEDIRHFHLHQHESGVGPAMINGAVSAPRFLFLVTLKRRDPGFEAIVDSILEASWTRGEVMRSLKRLVAADNAAQRENAKLETELAITRAMIRAGKAI